MPSQELTEIYYAVLKIFITEETEYLYDTILDLIK